VTHAVASLLHHVAARCKGDGYTRAETGDLCEAIPEARRLGLVESPERGRGDLDHCWLRLTPTGRAFADESLDAMASQLERQP